MGKKGLFAFLALGLLGMVSCSRELVIEPQEEPRATMIDPWTAIDQSPYMQAPVPGPGVSLTAGLDLEEDSKATLDVHDTYAKVVWNAGDSLFMYGYSGGFHVAPFVTTSGGDQVNIHTKYIAPADSPVYCIAVPRKNYIKLGHNSSDGVFFGLNLPAVQVAQAGKVQDEYLYSFAQAADKNADLHFKSIVSLVRFKMSGSAAASVTSVKLQGVAPLAGDFVILPATDGKPQASFTLGFSGDEPSNTVTLTGSFAADTWYYFAVAPGTQGNIILSFSDGVKTTNKVSSKAVTFKRGRITSLGTINLGSTLGDPDTAAPIKYMSATAGAAKPVTIAVIPDGFTSAEMPKYEMLAKAAVNTLFNVEPFASYREYFNVYILKQASNASGARISDGTYAEQYRDCYFESSWPKNSYDGMRANDNKVFDFVKLNCPDVPSIHPIDEVPVLMIINDARYGGVNWTYETGRAYCMAPYTYSGGKMSWSYPEEEAVSEDNTGYYQPTSAERYAEVGKNVGNWLNTMVHEFGGHCFGRLADEYWYGPTYYINKGESGSKAVKAATAHSKGYDYAVPFGHNVSATYSNPGRDDTYGATGWQFLLDQKSTLAGKDAKYNRIGVYQGGDVSMLNRWRSERVSCMIDNRFYFSTFQRYLIVKRIMTLAGVSMTSDAFDTMFWAKDVTIDPVRDISSSAVMGEDDPVPPRPMPMLPPPQIVKE